MPFNIIRDDITKLKTDAIVNAANSSLLHGGGVCGAIFDAAGAEALSKECAEIGYCSIGNAVITKGYNLNAKYIIHTVGPIYGQDPANEEGQLYSCYESSLNLAKKKKLSSIAFPLISSGIYGYPKSEAIKIASNAIKDFLKENEMDVFLVVYDKKAFQISEKLFDDVRSFIDEKLIKPDARRRFDADYLPINESVFYPSQKSLNVEYEDLYAPCDIEDGEVCDMVCSDSAMPPQSQKLKEKKSLEELMNIRVETFSEMLLRMIDEKGMTDVEVYKRANIDRKLFSKIRKKDYTPKKVTVVALIIALRLNMEEAKELLGRAGFAFTQSSKFDIIIEYFIERNRYDIFEINETLFAFEQQLLGA